MSSASPNLLILWIVLLLTLAGCAAGADPNLAASVNGVDITIADLEERLDVIRQNPQAAEQLANDSDGTILREAENQILNDLISQALLEQGAAEELGIEITDADVEAQRETVVEEIGGQEAFDQVIEQQGLTEEQVDSELRRLALNEAIAAQFAEGAEISDEEVEAFYDENAESRYGPTATARHILVADEATAQSAIDRIAGGEDFADVASELSTDTASGAQGGDLGELRPGDTVPEFDEALFSSPVGVVVGPVQTQFGFHVIEVQSREDEGVPLEDVEEEIREELAASGTETQVQEFVAAQSAEAEVTVNPRFGEWNAETGRVEPETPLGEASEAASGSEAATDGAVPPVDPAASEPAATESGVTAARLVLVDTSDALPGLLPLHAWSALMSSDLVLIGHAGHPFRSHLELAELRVEVVADQSEGAALSRSDLLSGLSPGDKRRAGSVVDRAREVGEVVYLFGPSDADAFTRVLGMEAARAGVEVEVVYFGVAPKGTTLLELVAVQQRLRAGGGCPWDAEQTHASLARFAVEEVYELLEAIASGDPDALREELGDVLLQVVFHAEIAESFTIDDVARGLVDKLVRRHPHVFAEATAEDAGSVVANWEVLKAAEKPERTGLFDGVPIAQPAVHYARQLQARAARTGFDWLTDAEAAERVRLELDEFLAAADDAAREHELGDLLFSAIGLARRHDLDPEQALRGAARRFRSRVEAMVAEDGAEALRDLDRDAWLARWERAKAAEVSADE